MAAPTLSPNQPPAAMLLEMLSGRWLSQAISCAAELGIADHLKDGPRPVEDLARELGAHEDALYRLLRSLEAYGIFAQPEPRRFGLTALGSTLKSDAPHSMRGVARLFGSETMVRAWARMPFTIREGKPALDQVTGTTGFDFLAADPAMATLFHQAMTSFSRSETNAVLARYDFSGIERMVDVGGGHGHLLAGILGRYPAMKGVLFELSHALEGARATFAQAGLGARVEVIAGDIFAESPPTADAVLMKHVLHDWSDDDATAILKRCGAALAPGGRLLVAEMVEPAEPVPHPSKLLDLEMLTVTQGGRERDLAAFEALFTAAGFRLARVVETPAPISVLEAKLA